MKRPYLSIIIPTLNEQYYLPRLLNDLSRQNSKVEFEIIVVDGSSDDDTVKLAKKYQKKFNLKIINSKKRNLSYQRNLGYQKSKGNYLVFIDADSRVKSDFNNSLYQSIEKDPALLYIPKIMPQEESYFDHQLFKILNYFVIFSQAIGKPIMMGACLICQKDFFKFLGMFRQHTKHDKEELFPEDVDLFIRARKSGVIAKYLGEVLVSFSLRRIQKEGRLTVMRRSLVSGLEVLITGKTDLKINTSYQMGGHYYSPNNKNKYSPTKINYYLKKLNQVKKQLSALLKEL